MNQLFRTSIIGAGLALASSCASASSLVYTPTNPTFGGNPLNGTFLLQQAQAQGEGAKSGQNSPDLSGLNNALSNLGNSSGPSITISFPGTSASGSSASGSSSGSSGSGTSNAVRIGIPRSP
jgi:curli production assembly/transport component CsgF